MTGMPPSHLGQDWLAQVFRIRSAQCGGVVRRTITDVHREIGRDAPELEALGRGWHLLQSGEDYILVCTRHPFLVIFQARDVFRKVSDPQFLKAG